MTVVVTHTTPADGTFSATGAAAWDATHTLSGVGTMAEQNANNVAITGGTISGVTLPAGGSTLQVQYNNAGAIAGMSGTSWDDTNRSLTVTGATVTTSNPVLNLSQTWNAAGVTFTGAKINVTDTASNSSSLLMDLQVGGTSFANITKSGVTTFGRYGVNGAYGFQYDPTTNGRVTLTRSSGGGIVSTWDAGANSFSVGTVIGVTTFQVGSSSDLFMTRRAAANLRFGAADAASPVAQTLSVQSVVAGTTDTAGADWTLTGSQSTGTGTAGNIVLQTSSSAASTGSAQNALATIATFGPSTLRLAQTTPALNLAQTWNTSGTATGIKLNVTDTASNIQSKLMDLQVNGTSKVSFSKEMSGSIIIGANSNSNPYGNIIISSASGGFGSSVVLTSTFLSTTQTWYFGSGSGGGSPNNNFRIGDNNAGRDVLNIITGTSSISTYNGGSFSFSSTSSAGGAPDLYIYRDAANTLAQRNGVNAQTFRLYNTFTDASNYERIGVTWASNIAYIQPQNAGTGSARLLVLSTGSTVVASLPAAATAGAGARAFVTDATLSMTLGIGTTVAGGGANKVPVYSDATNWLIG